MKYLDVTTYHDTQIVSTADLKEHLRITFSDDDTYIASLEKAAVRRLEEYTNLLLLNSTVRQYGFEFSDLEVLFKGPYYPEGITKVYSYIGGSWVLISASDIEFITKSLPMRVYKMPDATLSTPDDVKQKYYCEYQLGYETADEIPDPLIQAIKIMVADMYENRQSVIVGRQVSEIPKTAEYLMMPYKIQTL